MSIGVCLCIGVCVQCLCVQGCVCAGTYGIQGKTFGVISLGPSALVFETESFTSLGVSG